MTRWTRWAALVGTLIFTAVPAAQAAETTVRAQAQVAVEQQAAVVGIATSEVQAARDQRALQPSVNRAIEAGSGPELLATSTNPSVLADLARHAKVTVVHTATEKVAKPVITPAGSGPTIATAETARVRIRAHSAGCYGSPYDQYVWTAPWGSTLGWLYARENGWCGSGGRITWYGGPTFANYAWGPYCIANWHTGYAWDGYPAWIHMAAWGSLGVSYPWGCAGVKGGHAAVRIAWTGYWDRYDDWGI